LLKTPLHISAEYGHVKNLQLLLSHGARIDLKDGLGFSALDLAVKGAHSLCAVTLEAAQVNHEIARLETFNGLLKACVDCNTDLMLKLFKELKQDLQMVINMTVEGSNTILFKYILIIYLILFFNKLIIL